MSSLTAQAATGCQNFIKPCKNNTMRNPRFEKGRNIEREGKEVEKC
jgi:hypothetical protein